MSRQTIRLKDPLTEKAVRDVLDRIMKLENKLAAQVGQLKQTEGAPGSVRAVKGADGKTHLHVRTEEGWHDAGELTITQPE